ncbi:MAG: rhodanese-like domain-containing protein [Alphaproteobacteria bacterium]|nr:rhodanese-like domain-containing protein [Alphaproteobacteria bacterium]
MKQFALLAILAASIIGASAIAGAVRANEIAVKAADNVHESHSEEHGTATTHMDAEAQVEAQYEAVELNEITAEDLQILIDTSPELVIIDARRGDSFAEGHIPGAVALTADNATAEAVAAIAPKKTMPMVFYCGNVKCPASAKVAHKVADMGYNKLYKYSGGIDDWKAKGLPLATQ